MPAILERWEVLPNDALVELDDGILTVTGTLDMPLAKFPRRMTVVRLSGHRTAIFSAIALDEPDMARIEALGEPSFLIVPGDHHRMDAKIWKQRYPAIQVIAPPGAAEAVREVVPVDATGDVLGDDETKLVLVPGAGGHEVALEARRASGLTLVVNDLIANVAHPAGLATDLLGRALAMGVREPQVPRIAEAMIIDDRLALADQFDAWARVPNLRRIVPSHGEVIDDNPAGVLRRLADGLD